MMWDAAADMKTHTFMAGCVKALAGWWMETLLLEDALVPKVS